MRMKLDNKLRILQYCHCSKCLDERPDGVSPREWAQNEIGFTKLGLQVWCRRHECNIMHIDFEGAKHPADTTYAKQAEEIA